MWRPVFGRHIKLSQFGIVASVSRAKAKLSVEHSPAYGSGDQFDSGSVQLNTDA